jgi:hypothetical protein
VPKIRVLREVGPFLKPAHKCVHENTRDGQVKYSFFGYGELKTNSLVPRLKKVEEKKERGIHRLRMRLITTFHRFRIPTLTPLTHNVNTARRAL